MTMEAVLLFGSQARGDALPGSDVDVLLLTAEERTRHVAMGTISFYLYPWRYLLSAARRGDLFACHVSCEAKALHDPKRRLDRLREAFKFKASYAEEMARAGELGWFIVRYAETLPDAVVAKRAAWCVRTMLIARAADQRRPIFAASELALFSGCDSVIKLIGNKDEPSAAEVSADLLRTFLKGFGVADPIPQGNVDAFRELFRRTGNHVAEQTLRAGERQDPYIVPVNSRMPGRD